MKLVDMKISKADREKQSEPSTLMKDGPAYPWGLSINLDNATLEKLGLELPDVGEELIVLAQCRVTSCSSSDSEGGGKNRSCSLQIVAMGVQEEADDEGAADKLYEK